MKNAIGLIEAVGLAVGIEVADAMVKSANVRLIGYEFAKGNGMTVIKVEGDVGSVNAAIDAGRALASKFGPNKIYSFKVIPRPAENMEKMIYTKDTVLSETKVECEEPDVEENSTEQYTCNICKDQKCPRKKGEPKNLCIKHK